MIEIESYINAISVGFFRKSIKNDDFWAKEIQRYRISEDFPFHFKSSIAKTLLVANCRFALGHFVMYSGRRMVISLI